MCYRIGEIHAFGLCRNCYQKEYREKRRAKGICTECGKEPIAEGRSKNMCYKCLDKYRKKIRIKRYPKKKEAETDAELKRLGIIK